MTRQTTYHIAIGIVFAILISLLLVSLFNSRRREREALGWVQALQAQIDIVPEPIEVPEPIVLEIPTTFWQFPIHPEDFSHFTSAFGSQADPFFPAGTGGVNDKDHGGVDVVPLKTVWDARVRPAAAGVVSIHWPPKGRPVPFHPGWAYQGDPERGAWIEILHDNGWKSRYLHLSWTNPDVIHEGWRVETTDTIGRVGGSGRTTGSHLHFELINPEGQRVNPLLHVGLTNAR